MTDAQKVVDEKSSDIKTVNAAWDALISAMSHLAWADTVEFKTFKTVPDLACMDTYILDEDWDSASWEAELDGTIYRIVIGGHKTDSIVHSGMLYTSMPYISSNELANALLAQCETIVIETYTDNESKGGTVASRYLAYLAVNDGLDRTALHAAVESTRGLAEADYTAEQWLAVQNALTQARKVYADKTSTQEQIDAAAKALSEAVANKSGSTPAGEIKDIGLTYGGYGAFSILGKPGEYSDAYFQIVAGEYATNLTDMCGYNTNDWMSNGYANAQNPDKMWEYIKTNCKQGDKYVVTIKLYHYNEDTGEFTPYLVDGKQVEFLVYVTE